MTEKTIVEQERTNSRTWWVGMIGVVAQCVCSLCVLAGWISADVAVGIQTAIAPVLGYCNGNNPSIRGRY